MTTQEFQYQQIITLRKKYLDLKKKIDLADELIKRIDADSRVTKPRDSHSVFSDLFYSWKEIYEDGGK